MSSILERFGFPPVIGRQAIRALEPELSDRIGMAVLFPQNRSMKDYKLVLALAERFVGLPTSVRFCSSSEVM